MIETYLSHPAILHALAAAGHGARVLVADGNYPASTEVAPRATRVDLNLRRGLINAPDVVAALVETMAIESALMMQPMDDSWPEVQEIIRSLLPNTARLERSPRHEFYAAARSGETALVIVTGEARRFANILLTMGVVLSDPASLR